MLGGDDCLLASALIANMPKHVPFLRTIEISWSKLTARNILASNAGSYRRACMAHVSGQGSQQAAPIAMPRTVRSEPLRDTGGLKTCLRPGVRESTSRKSHRI
jgi:hypothetical protein